VGVEIERRFLVTGPGWRAQAGEGVRYCQGYLADGDTKVRIRRAGDAASITVKGPRDGIARAEFEYAIPVEDAEEMLRTLCQRPVLEKTRHEVSHGGHLWEIDVYAGLNAGLVLAEVELSHVDEQVVLPHWAGEEVTGDPRYSTGILAGSREPEPE
jgi:CYTH domain-containing protein